MARALLRRLLFGRQLWIEVNQPRLVRLDARGDVTL